MDREALHALIDRLPPELREEVFEHAMRLLERAGRERIEVRHADLHRGTTRMSEDFDAPLAERFWLGE